MIADPLTLGLGIGIPAVLGISYYVYKNTKNGDNGDNVDKGEWYGSQFNDPKNPIGIHTTNGGSRKRRNSKKRRSIGTTRIRKRHI